MTYEASVKITNPTGLHARPAVKLAQLAAGFDADIVLRVGDGGWVKARSTAKVMKLKARAESTLHFRAEGEQAARAVAALVDLVKRDFDEQDATPAAAPAGKSVSAETEIPAPASESSMFNAEIGSEGLALGRLFWVREQPALARQKGSVQQEQRAFEQAVGAARRQLERLIESSDRAGADILTFQVELLRDDELIQAVGKAIGNGAAAHDAWARALDHEIADYENADDDLFRSRAGDLRDLRDRVLALLSGAAETELAAPDGAVVVADELSPSLFLTLAWERLAGAVMLKGSRNSHVAMLARARAVPLLIGLQADRDRLGNANLALLDGEIGVLQVNPDADSMERFRARMQQRKTRIQSVERYLEKPARSSDGIALTAYINVDDPALLNHIQAAHCDGIGLTRTEFLFDSNTGLADEEIQYRVYRRLLDWAQGRAVTIRTLDAGGDKPIAGLTPQGESNPFLGVRGLRLSLNRPDIFTVQLRALARAAAHGPLKVMLPMVTLPAELEQARSLLRQQVEALQEQNIAARMPALGIMVEVPAAALTIADFDADFFSIGSNDLIQYTLAAGRDCPGVSALQDPLHPAVLELIARVAQHGARVAAEVSVCGEMAARPECIAALLNAGITALSVPPASLAQLKATLAETPIKGS